MGSSQNTEEIGMIERFNGEDGRITIEADFDDQDLILDALERYHPKIRSRLSHNLIVIDSVEMILDADAAGIYLMSMNDQADKFLIKLLDELDHNS